MTSRIEDYALIGDCQTAALVGRDGSIDWLCLPRFDSDACFAAMLGTPEHGHWSVAPSRPPTAVRRAYRDGSMILDTTFETDEGAITLTDFMPIAEGTPQIVRTIRGVRGRVAVHAQLRVRFDYGSIVPWVRKGRHGILAIAGPDSLRLQSDVPLRGDGLATVADFEVAQTESVSFILTWYPSHADEPKEVDAQALMQATERAWREWSAQCTYRGEWRPVVLRSLVTLKALTHGATGGIVAAPTTSLPEAIGGVRNWDYRYCWVRDATFTLLALLHNGFEDEARAWREWLLRAVAGDPSKLQIMYAVDGRRRIEERNVPWLPGYEGSSPVRVGNAAFEQRQLDVYGEVMDALHQCSRYGLAISDDAWDLRRSLLDFLESSWDQPDEGIWEMRGPPRQFTHSKVMAWVAFDRAVHHVENVGSGGPLERWRAIRDRIHADVCELGYDGNLRTFVQSFGSKQLDASLLMIPLVGFLPATDERVVETANAIERTLPRAAWYAATTASRRLTGYRPARGRFCPAASGWPTIGLSWGGMRTRERSSSGSSPCATTSACSRRSTTRRAEGSSAISLKPSLTCLSSTPRVTSRPSKAGPRAVATRDERRVVVTRS